MSLRCSLLGHEYGEREIERDREERGNEVVISVVELERCSHCGATKTLSENTEVTQLSGSTSGPEAVPTTDPAPPDSRTGTSGSGSGIRPRPDTARSTGTDTPQGTTPTAERTEPGATGRPDASSAEEPTERTGVETGVDPAAEDAEIIEDGPADDDREREPTAWPDVDDHEGRAGGSADPWPAVEGEDEGFDAAAPDGPTDLEFGGGLTPQADQGAEVIEEGEADGDGTVVSAAPTSAPDRREPDEETVLFCPNCETSDLAERDSLRAGDICPACHKGYLGERGR